MNLRTAVLDLGEQVEAVADGDRRLPGHEPHPHQSQTDPRQPILTRLTVGVEKRPNALEVITDFIIYFIRKEKPCKCFNHSIQTVRIHGNKTELKFILDIFHLNSRSGSEVGVLPWAGR